jgi:ankyrin repeat protein
MSSFSLSAQRFLAFVQHGNLTEARAEVNAHPELIYETDGVGETPLHWLVVENELDGVRLLIERGADLNTNTANGSPLHSAASLGYLEMVGLLLKHNANIAARDRISNDTPLHWAARHACNDGVIDLLIDAGADVEARNNLGDTPLLEAVSFAKTANIRKLLARGANARARDDFESGVLHELKADGTLAMLELLVAHGADLRAVDLNGNTVLHSAYYHANQSLIEYLLGAGLDPNARNLEGATPADEAERGRKNRR